MNIDNLQLSVGRSNYHWAGLLLVSGANVKCAWVGNLSQGRDTPADNAVDIQIKLAQQHW